jgi:vacuolar-type H+-ATPase subunit E/Vma4
VGLPELLATMDREARARAESIRQAARDEAARIMREADDRASSRQTITVDAERIRMREAGNHRVAQERRLARRELLERRQELLERVRSLVRSQLAGVGEEPRYRTLLPDLARSSLQSMNGTGVRLRAAPRLSAELAAIMDGRVTVEEDPSIDAGFVVESGDGRRQVDHRLAQRLDALWPRIAIVLCREIGTSL